jgi:hypothetical protein
MEFIYNGYYLSVSHLYVIIIGCVLQLYAEPQGYYMRSTPKYFKWDFYMNNCF